MQSNSVVGGKAHTDESVHDRDLAEFRAQLRGAVTGVFRFGLADTDSQTEPVAVQQIPQTLSNAPNLHRLDNPLARAKDSNSARFGSSKRAGCRSVSVNFSMQVCEDSSPKHTIQPQQLKALVAFAIKEPSTPVQSHLNAWRQDYAASVC